MTRVLVSAFHTFLAATYAMLGTALLVQAQLNSHWERGFYGEVTVLTGGVVIASLLVLALASFQAISSIGYALGSRPAGWGLLGFSLLLSMATPAPLRWLVAATAGAIGVDLWMRTPRPPDEEREDDDEPFF